jgi:hypothetical protein
VGVIEVTLAFSREQQWNSWREERKTDKAETEQRQFYPRERIENRERTRRGQL